MKRAATAFTLILRDSVGIEGTLIVFGTACAAVAASFAWGTGGALAVIGGVSLALGFAVAWRGA